MSPGQRSGPGGDLGRAENLAAAKQFDLVSNGTPSDRQHAPGRTEVRHVFAIAYAVRGTRGRDRLDLFVTCWLCGRLHRHGAKPDFVSGKRTAACGLGRYQVHLGTVEGQVAA